MRFQTQEKFANIWQVLTIQTFIFIVFYYLTFVCKNKQGNQCNSTNLSRKFVSEKLSIIDPLLKEEKPLQFESTNIVAKKPQPLANLKKDRTGMGKKRKVSAHPLIMQMYNTQGRGGERVGGGCGSFALHLFMKNAQSLLNFDERKIDILQSESRG